MSATPPVRPETPPDANAAAQLRLAQALQHARWSIGWERAWPSLARVLSVIGLFLVASWAGLWLVLSPIPRTIGLALFVIALIATLYPFIRFRWPTREEGLARLDHGSGIRHRPATALTDTLSSQDPLARALWLAQRERTLASLKRIRAGLPSPRLPLHDPWALRALVVVLLVATWFAASGERNARIMAAFDWKGIVAPSNVRVDAWVNPPPYTAKPPIILSAANNNATNPDAAAMSVPSGSTLIVRSSGGALDVALTGGVAEVPPAADAPAGTNEKHYSITGDGTAQVRAPTGQPVWKFTSTGDRPPVISLAKDPERQARGSLLLAYKIEDDYGVTEAHAQFAAKPADSKVKPRPLFDPPSFSLVLPNARTRNGVGQTVKDLSEDPYAGAEVMLTLTAKDEAGNEGRSDAIATRLPERLFTKPLPRALIEQRRNLALDANQKDLVVFALEALMIAPEAFTPDAGHYLGLRSVLTQAQRARTDNALKEVVASLWSLAVTIEDGDITDVDKALKAAQDALKQALERGASDEEIKKLTENLRAALDKFLKQLAEQMKQNPQQLARPLDKNSKVMRQQDLNNMIERMERLSRSGDKDAAKQLLEQMQQMLENLQMAQPGQGGDDEMQQSMNELGDMIRKQQQLRDKTFKEGQDQRGERRRGKQGEKGMGDLQQDQQNLRDRLKKLQEQLARQGMGQGQKGQKGQQGQQGQGQQGQQGQQGEQGQNGGDQDGDGDGLGDADGAMGDAGGQLGDGDADGAVGSQGRALEALRKGAQSLAQQMQQGEGEGGQDGPGNNPGRQQGAARNSDPLGRPLRSRDLGDDFSVKIPGEIDVQRVRRILEELRRRLGDTTRPQLELDYIERLLKDY